MVASCAEGRASADSKPGTCKEYAAWKEVAKKVMVKGERTAREELLWPQFTPGYDTCARSCGIQFRDDAWLYFDEHLAPNPGAREDDAGRKSDKRVFFLGVSE